MGEMSPPTTADYAYAAAEGNTKLIVDLRRQILELFKRIDSLEKAVTALEDKENDYD